MGGCASKPKDSDDKRPAPIPIEDSPSSLKKTQAAADATLENKEAGEKQEKGDENKQNEPPLVDLTSEPKQEENDNASCEPKTNVSTDSDAVKAQPETQDKVENAEVATAAVAKDPASIQSVDAPPTKLEDKDTPLVTL